MIAHLLTATQARLSVCKSRRKTGIGTDQARRKLEPKGVTLGASFFMHGKPSMVNRAGLPKGCAGPLVRFLVDPYGSPPVIDQETDGDCKPQSLEAFPMSLDTPTGEIRPNTTILSERAVKARLRRRLAHVGFILRINRPGTLPFMEYGPCHIEEPRSRQIIKYGMTLEELARYYDILGAGEAIGGGV